MSSSISELRNQTKSWTKGEYLISTDTSLIPIQTLNTWYASEEFYWAKPMPEPALHETIKNSLCFGLYHNSNQTQSQSDKTPENDAFPGSTLEFVGFARCVTDYTTFLFLTDVFVLSSLQGLGLGTWLVTCVQEVIETMPYLRRSLLLTGDWKRSVPFYEKFMDMELMVCNPPVDGKDAVGFAVMQRKSWGAPGFGEMP
ncbi:Acyl-CoA N-acyltransferase [Penicillium italicum]|uniref:Acyl-CoA N-acyltransferase n=1 Tax=Penicillium italicum TaxID=40296 RepID=A0A0A2KAV4_PENIT|nr:Acyl-CoA N-acyltransferase [Penicillium italicum]